MPVSIQTIHIVLKAYNLWEVFSYTVKDMKENKSRRERRNKKVKEKQDKNTDGKEIPPCLPPLFFSLEARELDTEVCEKQQGLSLLIWVGYYIFKIYQLHSDVMPRVIVMTPIKFIQFFKHHYQEIVHLFQEQDMKQSYVCLKYD